MKKEHKNWDRIKDYVWENSDGTIQLMSFTNDDKPNIKCVYIKLYKDDEWVSNYFLYDKDTEEVDALEFAELLVSKYNKEENE